MVPRLGRDAWWGAVDDPLEWAERAVLFPFGSSLPERPWGSPFFPDPPPGAVHANHEEPTKGWSAAPASAARTPGTHIQVKQKSSLFIK